MLFEKKYEEILGEALTELTSNTRINKTSAGTKARALLEILSRKLNESYRVFDLNLARAFLSAATGRYLDFIGELLNLPRLGINAASADASTKSVRFFVETGTFGTINSGANISIPIGTIIGNQANGQGATYRATTTTVLLAASSSTYIAVEAVVPGESSNVGQGSLVFHTFTNYVDAINNTLKVTNDQGIFTGRDIESDTNYRFRLTRAVTAAESANRSAILLASLSIPGVAEVNFVPYGRGIGTFDIIVKSVTPTVSTSLLNAVQSAVDVVSAQGTIPKARKPIETGVTFSATIKYTNGVPATERAAIEQKIRTSLTSYVNSLDIGQELVINEAVQRVLEVDERIKDIGIPSKPFNDISIYIPTKLQDNKVRNTLLKNYVPAADERVIIEPSVVTPIALTTEI